MTIVRYNSMDIRRYMDGSLWMNGVTFDMLVKEHNGVYDNSYNRITDVVGGYGYIKFENDADAIIFKLKTGL